MRTTDEGRKATYLPVKMSRIEFKRVCDAAALEGASRSEWARAALRDRARAVLLAERSDAVKR